MQTSRHDGVRHAVGRAQNRELAPPERLRFPQLALRLKHPGEKGGGRSRIVMPFAKYPFVNRDVPPREFLRFGELALSDEDLGKCAQWSRQVRMSGADELFHGGELSSMQLLGFGELALVLQQDCQLPHVAGDVSMVRGGHLLPHRERPAKGGFRFVEKTS